MKCIDLFLLLYDLSIEFNFDAWVLDLYRFDHIFSRNAFNLAIIKIYRIDLIVIGFPQSHFLVQLTYQTGFNLLC